MNILAIDPGNIESAYCLIDTENYKPIEFGKVENQYLKGWLSLNAERYDKCVIEMIASYGMAVGESVFQTCVWIGRFTQVAEYEEKDVDYIYRKEEKMNLCGSMRAKDSNIRQALIDRFAKFDFKNGKGTKKEQDFFYGFSKDVWASFAVGVTYIDKIKEMREVK